VSSVRLVVRRLALGFAAASCLLVLPAPAGAKVPSGFFGIFAEGPTAREFKDMGKAGFGSYRVPVNWKAIQKTRKGDYAFGQADYGVLNATRNHMRPVLVVFGTPRFVHKPTTKGLYGPTSKGDLNQWKQFTRALAERYGPGGSFFAAHPGVDRLPVRTWIMWNEQNSKNNWLPKADPRAYGKLVKKGEEGITKVDSGAEIVLGGMYGHPRDAKSMKAKKYLSRLYRVKGIATRFDAINSHPYGSGVGDVRRQIGELRSVAKRNRDGGVGLYVGEMGWASRGPTKSESVVGRKGQAKRLRGGLELLAGKRRKWNVGGAFVYTWKDFPAGQIACNWCPGAGLLTKGGKPKPALRAVKKVIRRRG
jgi:hypothetical protein